MIYVVIIYVLFLALYLPFNFYMIVKIHDLRLEGESPSVAMNFLIGGIATVVLISLITIAAFEWPAQLSILK